MNRKNKYRERLPIAEWPEVERKMAIIARMTSEPPLIQPEKDRIQLQDEVNALSQYSDGAKQKERNIIIE